MIFIKFKYKNKKYCSYKFPKSEFTTEQLHQLKTGNKTCRGCEQLPYAGYKNKNSWCQFSRHVANLQLSYDNDNDNDSCNSDGDDESNVDEGDESNSDNKSNSGDESNSGNE